MQIQRTAPYLGAWQLHRLSLVEAMIMEEREFRIHNAVRQCVRECHSSLTPFLAIGKYCDRLRAAGALAPGEVEQVESLAWRELQSIRGEFGHDR